MFNKLILVLIWLGMTGAMANAQTHSVSELGLLLGAPVTPELNSSIQPGRISFGSGVTFQATFAHRLARLKTAAIYFELPFATAPNIPVSSDNRAVPANYASLFVTPGVRLKFRPNAKIAPWLAAGGGYARFDESAEQQNGLANPGRIGANRGAAQFGGGAIFTLQSKYFSQSTCVWKFATSIPENLTTTCQREADFSTTYCFQVG